MLIFLPVAVLLAIGLATAPAATAANPNVTRPNEPSAQSSVGVKSETAAEVRMTKLIGMDVHNPSGEKVGAVKDVILDTNTGRVHYAVLSVGGFLGVRERLFAVPLGSARIDDKGRLVLDVTKEKLKSMPGFDRKHWPDWSSSGYRAELEGRHGAAPVEADARFRRASDLLKSQVRDVNLADIGDIKDIVVDLSNSRVHYVVAKFDRAWTPNDKLVALPMSALGAVATMPPPQRTADASAPPRKPSSVLALETPSGPSKGTASATNPPPSVETRPPPIDPLGVMPIPKNPLKTTTSYADDEDLVYKGTREQLLEAPSFDRKSYPDLRDSARRAEFDRRLSR